MKKLLSLFIVFILLFSACKSESKTVSSPRFTVDNFAFSCDPQDLIDTINKMTEKTGSIPKIGDWESNTEDLQISGSDLTMHIHNSLNKVSLVEVDWKAAADQTIQSQAEVLTEMLLNFLVPNPEPLQQKISSAIKENSESVNETHDYVSVQFDPSKTNVVDGENSILIKVIEKPLQRPRST